MINEYLTTALEWLAAGRSVIPIDPGTKRPVIAWKDLQTKPLTPDAAREIWGVSSPPWVALLATAHDLVFDCDTKWLADSVEGALLHKAKLVRSGGEHAGNVHVYLHARKPARTSHGNGYDIVGAGGYTVIPPSGNYRAINELPPLEIEDVNEWVATYVPEVVRAKAPKTNALDGTPIRAGGRSGALQAIAGQLRYLNFAPAYVEAALDGINAAFCDPPLPEHSTRTQEGWRDLAQNIAVKTPWTRKTDHGFIAECGPETAEAGPIHWLIENFILGGYLNLIFAPEGSGKSYTALTSAISIATGIPWIGKRAVERAPVIYCDYEMDFDAFRYRAFPVAYGMGLKGLPADLHYVRPSVALPRYLDDLARHIAVTGAKVVFLDSLTISLGGVNVNDNQAVGDVLMQLIQLPATIIALDHTSKGKQLGQRDEEKTAFGAGAKQWNARNLWQIIKPASWHPTEMRFRLIHKKSSFDVHPEDINLRAILDVEKVSATQSKLRRVDLVEADDFDSLDEAKMLLQRRGRMTLAELESTVGCARTKATELMRELEKRGFATADPDWTRGGKRPLFYHYREPEDGIA